MPATGHPVVSGDWLHGGTDKPAVPHLKSGAKPPATVTYPMEGEEVCRRVLAVMATAGLYETRGDWLYEVELPAKSGVGGGIVTVSPGKGGMATYAPPLDAAGNSVRGQLVARYLAHRLSLDIFTSSPDPAHYASRKTQKSFPRKENT